MTCEACGGDGLIEYGAYRGDEQTETRKCHLCGGVITTDGPLEKLATAAKNAGTDTAALAQAAITTASMFNCIDTQGTENARRIREGELDASMLRRAAKIAAKWNKR